MKMKWLKTRQTKYVAYLVVYVAVILAVVVIANMLADRYNKRYDGTANKRYSLSDQTLKVVKGLKQDATITYFDYTSRFSESTGGAGAPSPKDLLDRYANISTKVHVQFIDPDKKPDIARAAGIKNYGVAVVQVGNRKEEAKSLSEEGITGALIRDLKGSSRNLCFVAGSGEHQIEDTERTGFSILKELLAKDNYGAKTINLLQKAEVPSDCTVLVAGGPTADYQQPEVDAIKKFIEGGGRALIMLEPPLKAGRTQIADNDALGNLLQSWGVTLDKNLVLDTNPIGQLAGLGPEIVLVTKYPSHPIVNDLKRTATGFPVTRSMQIKNADKTTVEKLIESSEGSMASTNMSAPSMDDPKNKQGPFTIGVAGTYKAGENSGRFVVIGCARWAENSFLGFNGNHDLAMNTINWLSSDEDLISIRPKEQEDRRITMTRSQLTWVRNTSQFLLPLGVVIAGMFVWLRRR